jgi:hypothetical protein
VFLRVEAKAKVKAEIDAEVEKSIFAVNFFKSSGLFAYSATLR